jgi:hypothetical protein
MARIICGWEHSCLKEKYDIKAMRNFGEHLRMETFLFKGKI